MRALALVTLAVLLAGCPHKENQTETQCVDAWLAARGLDEYGNPLHTESAGGNPAFDERTDVQPTPRIELVYRHHSEARRACARSLPESPTDR